MAPRKDGSKQDRMAFHILCQVSKDIREWAAWGEGRTREASGWIGKGVVVDKDVQPNNWVEPIPSYRAIFCPELKV